MFRRLTSVSLLLLLGATLAAGYSFARLDPADLPKYRQLIAESIELRSKSALEREPARQMRRAVQKDIWTLNGQRLHTRLTSCESELMIRQKKGKVEVTEELQNIECWLQEEISRGEIGKEQQQVRYFFAEEGTYLFPSHRFVAEEVDLYFFSLPGVELPSSWPVEDPFLSGTANEVVFSAGKGFHSFSATHLNAEFELRINEQ